MNMKKIVVLVVMLVAAVFAGQGSLWNGEWQHTESSGTQTESTQEGVGADEQIGVVSHVVDGDTVYLESGEKLRLIGIDTPERDEEYFNAATQFMKELVLDHEVMYVTDRDTHDRYGRLLVYVYAGDVFVNEEMVAAGLAEAKSYPPNTTKQGVLDAAEERARNAGVGLWER